MDAIKRFISQASIGIFVMTMMVIGAFSTPAFASTQNTVTGETPSGIPFTRMEEEVDKYVSKFIGKTTPGAAVAVVKDGEVIFLKGYGYADLESQITVDPKSTVFEWASVGKLFTWTSVMQLVEEGKLDLDTDVKEYLPSEFNDKLEYKQSITMRDVMNHAAGFGDYAFNAIVFLPDQLVSLEEAILRDKPKQYYEVGTASAYSNYATSLAGYIVQNISQQDYEDYVKENIFKAISMKNTSAHPMLDDDRELVESKAQGYLSDQQDGFHPGKWSYVSHLPAGSINGTVEDLAKYLIVLTPGAGEESVLFSDSSTLNTMLSPSYDPGGDMVGTAHGFFEYVGAYRTLGHGGNTAAFTSQLAIVPEERFGIAILTNSDLEMNFIFGLQDLLLGKNRHTTEKPVGELPSSEKVVGRYVPMERQEGNFLDFANYINLYEVNALDENKITMNIGVFQGTYLQTKAYHYELVDDNTPIFRNIYPVLRFKVENDTAKQVVIGNGMDLSMLPQGRTSPFLTGSIITLLVNLLFFIITPVILLVIAIKNRKVNILPANKKFNFYYFILVLLGTATVINNLIPSTKVMISSFHTFAAMKPHILLNYPLLIGAIITTVLSAYSVQKTTAVSKKYKVLYVITIVLLILLFAMLLHWNFFAVVG